jgi:hypothetical protein
MTDLQAVRERVAEMKAKSDACSPGWIFDGERSVNLAKPTRPDWGTLLLYKSTDGYDDTCACSPEELDFIAASRTAVPALLELVLALLEEREAMRDLPAMALGMLIGWSAGARAAMANGHDELERFINREYSVIPKSQAAQSAADAALQRFIEGGTVI